MPVSPYASFPRRPSRRIDGESTLADYVAALGGRLELLAVFPEGTVRIAQFGKSGDD